MPLGRLVDGFLGRIGRVQADDQEGVDEVRDGEDSRSGIPSKGLVRMSDKGWTKCEMGKIHEAEFQAKALSECLIRGLLVVEATEEDTMTGPKGDIEVLVHMEQASLAGVMEACMDDQFDVPSDVDLDGSDSEEDGSDGED
jgi:hypothetical protein